MVAINWKIIILLFSFNKPYPGISLIAVLTVLRYSTFENKNETYVQNNYYLYSDL